MIRIFGFIWKNLSITPWTPKSGEHEDQIKPFFDTPKKAVIVSIVLGTYAATLSFSFKFIFFKKWENLQTLSYNFSQVIFLLIPFSDKKQRAVSLFFLTKRFSA